MIIRLDPDDMPRVVSTVKVLVRDKLVKVADELKKQADKDIEAFAADLRRMITDRLHRVVDDILVQTSIDVETNFRVEDKTYEIAVEARLPKSPAKLAISNAERN
ncbi:MAG: hypothetical protein GEU78_10330 [Actinobacteria bacterium]|nr:hypothetical protein [Actinomycetota bacterium]